MPDSISIADEEPNWSLIGKELMKLFKRTAKYHIVLGEHIFVDNKSIKKSLIN